MYIFLGFALIVIAVLVTKFLTVQLIEIIRTNYPEVYEEYRRNDAQLMSVNFIAEFVIGGLYKHTLKNGDYKYVKRVRIGIFFIFVSILIDIYIVYFL